MEMSTLYNPPVAVIVMSIGDGGVNFYGNLYEIIFYTSALTTPQLQQIEGYLAWKWGLQKNLPSSHPFYNFPPG